MIGMVDEKGGGVEVPFSTLPFDNDGDEDDVLCKVGVYDGVTDLEGEAVRDDEFEWVKLSPSRS